VASSPQSYQKRQRELRKKERKAEKLAIRHGKSAAAKEAADDGQAVDEDALLEEFRLLNEKFAAGDVPEDDFEFRKAEPDLERIGRWMRIYVRVIASQGVMQVAIIVIMARFVTGF
jgi:hypothetical protein